MSLKKRVSLLSILPASLIASSFTATSGPTKILFEEGDLVIAYTDDWFYQGPSSDGTVEDDESFAGTYRVKTVDPNCWDFSELAWISDTSAKRACGFYRFDVVNEVNSSTFWADVWQDDQKPDEVPFGRVYVKDGLLECYRFYLTDGSYFEYKDRKAQLGCDWR